MESGPLLKRIFGSLLALLVAPLQHLWAVVNAYFLAKSFDDSVGIIQQIVGINDGDTDFAVAQLTMLTSDGRSDLLLVLQVIKNSAELVVAGFGGHEIVKPGDGGLGRDGTVIVRRDAAARMANQEGEVEFLENLLRNHCWITGLSLGIVGIWCLLCAVCMAVVMAIGVAI